MEPKILGLRTAIYKVTDIEKAKLWYNKVFAATPYFDQAFYVGYNIAGYELGLHPGDETPESKADSVMTYWGVENVETEFERMISLGAVGHEKPANVGGEIVVGSVKDPWGNVIGLIYNPQFKLPESDPAL